MRSPIWILLSASLAWIGAPRVSAGTLSVDFDLRASVIQLNDMIFFGNGTFSAPNPAVQGSVRVTVTDVDAQGQLLDGPARVQLSDLMLTFAPNPSSISGSIRIAQSPDSSPFTRLIESSITFDDFELALRATGSLDCPRRFDCALFVPPGQTVPLVFDTSLMDSSGLPRISFSFGFPPRPGFTGGSLSASLRGMQGAQPIALTILGREVNRAFVPEPAAVHTVLVGLLGLGLGRWKLARRARTR